jgi:hypothetical protein
MELPHVTQMLDGGGIWSTGGRITESGKSKFWQKY